MVFSTHRVQRLSLFLFFLLASCQTTLFLSGVSETQPPLSTAEPPTVSAVLDGDLNEATAVSPTIENSDEEASSLPMIENLDESAENVYLIQVDAAKEMHTISPFIYGLSDTNEQITNDLRPTLVSWGGNASTRYNWQLGNAWNAGSDWEYRNGNYGYTGPSASDELVMNANAANIAVRLALPTLGWVAKNDDNNTCSFPLAGGGCGDGNGSHCDNQQMIADPTLANVQTDMQFITDWVNHLLIEQDFDIQFLAMDNEPELWGYTHYDVHPDCTTYAEILEKYLTVATAVRAVAPDVELTGPITCCWHYYWNSAAGEADKQAHNNQPFLPWFLDNVRLYDEANGIRTLDVLDIHFYPEGVYNNNVDQETAVLRLRSTRSLWDETYVDESWINEPIYLIPRMKQLIERHYPGTKLGISEWNWGADESMNGALAIADVLGILGREGVHMAAYWRFPPVGSPGYYAFKLFTNFDNQNGRFGDQSVWTQVEDVDRVSSYAAINTTTGNLHIVLINKQDQAPEAVQIQLTNFIPGNAIYQYQFSPADLTQITAESMAADNHSIEINLPAYSITHLVIEP